MNFWPGNGRLLERNTVWSSETAGFTKELNYLGCEAAGWTKELNYLGPELLNCMRDTPQTGPPLLVVADPGHLTTRPSCVCAIVISCEDCAEMGRGRFRDRFSGKHKRGQYCQKVHISVFSNIYSLLEQNHHFGLFRSRKQGSVSRTIKMCNCETSAKLEVATDLELSKVWFRSMRVPKIDHGRFVDSKFPDAFDDTI